MTDVKVIDCHVASAVSFGTFLSSWLQGLTAHVFWCLSTQGLSVIVVWVGVVSDRCDLAHLFGSLRSALTLIGIAIAGTDWFLTVASIKELLGKHLALKA